jgi:transposase-like protein
MPQLSYPLVTLAHMRDLELSHLIGRARLLRREGKTYDEIRAVIGNVSDGTLRTWLKGIPRPPETNRTGMAKPELRRKVRQLRAEGLTIGEIAELTGASQGSISVWMRDIRVPARVEHRRQAHLQELRGRGGKARHDKAVQESALRREEARRVLGAMTERDLLIAGAALYWAEGTKDKPWRRIGRVTFINSDLDVIQVFLAWLDIVGVPAEDRRYRLNIHETADVAMHEAWWAESLGLPDITFQRATLKRHNPAPRRLNVNSNYHGCLVVVVARSRALYDAIQGLWEAMVGGAGEGYRPQPT